MTEMLADDVREFDDILEHAKEVLLDANGFDYRFPTIRTWTDPIVDENGLPTRYEYLNYYDGTDYVREWEGENNSGDTVTIYSTLSPQLRIYFLLRKCFEIAGYNMAGVFDTYPDFLELRRLILFNNFTLDETDEVTNDPAWSTIRLRNSIRMSEHVPQDLLASEFVKRICAAFGWAIFRQEQERTVTIKPWKELLDAPFSDWTKKVHPRYIRQRSVEDLPTRYEYNHTSSDAYAENWPLRLNGRSVDYTFSNYQEANATLTPADIGKIVYIESVNQYLELKIFIAGDAALSSRGKSLGVINPTDTNIYDIDIDTLHTVTPFQGGSSHLGRPFGPEKMPAFYGEVVTPWGQSSGDPFEDDLILLFDRARQQTPDLNSFYAAASNNNYVAIDFIPVGNLSLIWTGESGMYNTWHRAWNEALQRMRPVTYATRLTAADLAQLDFSKKVRIDKHLYFLRRVKVTLTTDEIKPATVEYMQIN